MQDEIRSLSRRQVTKMLAERGEDVDSSSHLVLLRSDREGLRGRVGETARSEDHADWPPLRQGSYLTRWVAEARLWPDSVTVELDGVLIPFTRSKPCDRD
jgi:hypothetical protein